jgi:acetoacetyl-CoA synthetase
VTSPDPTIARGEILRRPTPEEIARSRVGRYLVWLERERGRTIRDYDELWRWSVTDLEGFWLSVWDHFGVIAHNQPREVLGSRDMPGARWFPGSTLNYAEHALRGDDGAEIVVVALSQSRARITLTRDELRAAVGAARAGLERLGVGPNDRVAGYLPNIPEALITMLATVSLGAIWVACAPEFGTKIVQERFAHVAPKVLVAVDGYRYGSKHIDRTDAVHTLREQLPTLEATVTVGYLHPDREAETADGATGPSITWDDLLAEPAPPRFDALPFDHPLWIVFSSGTTGLPKAITHSHGGIVLESLKSQALQCDLGPGDRYFVYATTSWVMWNLLINSMLVGASVVLFDGDPSFPDPAQLWRVVAEEHVTSFCCGASLVVAAMRQGLVPSTRFDLTHLSALSSTGSPLPAEAFRWIHQNVGRDLFIQSSSGGTEICGPFVGGSPMLPVRAGEIACRSIGVAVAALDAEGRPVIDRPGELVVSAPMPSMPLSFWNDPGDARYRASFFETYPDRWRHGDWIMFHADGACRILGRSDGTLNRGGVRLGTAEFYDALSALPEIDDSLVVHLEDPAGGMGRLVLFVQPAAGHRLDDDLRTTIVHELRSSLSPRHVPDRIHAVSAIPYGLTGKKLEIPIKRLMLGADRRAVFADGSVRDPRAIDDFEQFVDERSAARST